MGQYFFLQMVQIIGQMEYHCLMKTRINVTND